MQLRTMVLASVVAATCVIAGTALGQERAPGVEAGANNSLDAFIEQKMDEADIAGLGAAIIVDGKVVWTKGYGFADVAKATPFTPDTVMPIASISKTFTGVAMMRAVEEGKLSLDEDINAYLPFRIVNPHDPDGKITLRHLATHTSGITDRPEAYKATYHYDGDTPEPLAEFMRNYFMSGGSLYSEENFLKVKPGTHREYSNIASGLAGYVVETVTGEPLSAYTQRHLFDPLQMGNTGWSLSDIAPEKQSKLYVAHNGMTIPIPPYELTVYPDGGVRTSVSDLSKFFIALLGDGAYEGARILDPRSVEEMTRLQWTDSNKPDNINPHGEDSVNSGLFWATKFDVTRIGHAGSDPGVKTEMLANLSKDVGVILFTNTSLSGDDIGHHFGIFLELWKRAEALKNNAVAIAR